MTKVTRRQLPEMMGLRAARALSLAARGWGTVAGGSEVQAVLA